MNSKKFTSDFQNKVLASLIIDKNFLIQVHDIIDPSIFENKSREYILQEILSYYKKYNDTPTADALSNIVNNIDDDNFKKVIFNELDLIINAADSKDLKFVKEDVVAFCRDTAMKKAIYESVNLIKLGKYDDVRSIIDKALKSGQSYDIGLEYFDQIDERYEKAVRNVIPTPWPLINEVIDGGVGKGELVTFVGSPGAGKCVGPNTEINIEYEETGIDIGMGKILWFKPWDKFNIDDTILFGWQIEKIIFICHDLQE